MPELPEVENTRQYLLRSGLVGRRFSAPDITWSKTVREPSVGEFIEGVAGRRVADLRRRGKYLIAPLDDEQFLVLHLGMTGSLRIHDARREPPPMVRHTFPLDDGREMRFIDPRKFGHLWLLPDPSGATRKMGPEPLEPTFTVAVLAELLAGRKAPMKAILLDQSVVAGLGNLYADEALFLSGIHPERAANDLNDDEARALHAAIVQALSRSVAAYAAAREAEWPDPPVALSPWSIPRSSDEPCPKCSGTVAMIRVRGRSSWHCPECQPAR
ncbi:MAG: bifunctional DNA-formamidopyrimidine glycosylase/DNA-(apurinic or apyrimidinic site) lyase [Chloroflexota bacterium]|nr:bifunctional DNA-formamidopyrimidine glycosylase/DNA-(apurinic or apyrimidinic site) lyase [Chloroflexota bacterium]MDE2961648.1 bifunctional DNA-formamidopyrimidine glycosylase/DNA-(apurinic or apyrimidinic site) lyase [Chloroflexota bacterium]